MSAFYEMFKIVLLFVTLLVPGYILGKAKLISDGAAISIGNILVYVAMPSLVFSKLLGIRMCDVGVLELAISTLLPLVVVFVLLLVCKLIKKEDRAKKRAIDFCAVFANCGFLGIPLAASMWPNDTEIVLYVSLFNVLSTFLLLTVGVYALSGDKKQINVKNTLLSPIFFAIVLGVALSCLNIGDGYVYLENYSSLLANLTTPLAMIAAGYELSKLHLIKMWKCDGVYVTSLLKLILAPSIAFGVLALLKYVFCLDITREIAFAMLVSTAVSTAASAPAMAKKYGADSEYAAALTLSNTLLCVISMPLMYLLFDLVF